MKKVLIWDDFPLLNMGGPMGYCFQIHEYLKEHPTEQITFLSDLLPVNLRTTWENKSPNEEKPLCGKYRILKALGVLNLYKSMADLKNGIKSFYFARYKKGCKKIPSYINLNQYDYIHFHWTKDLSTFKYEHPEYKGKLILTSHSPSPISEEVFASMKPWQKKLFWHIEFKHECQTYDMADYLIFPCEGAREPYEKYPQMKDAMTRNNHKFIYNPSAILDLKVNIDSMQKYSDFGIPDNAFVITYFGRHNKVKGYDILKEIGARLLEKYSSLYFLVAGNIDIEPLRHPRWIELGFIKNANELMYQSNLYILPNRETYFDLVTLEVLRAGVPVILSNTGGNKFFHQYSAQETYGVNFFEIDDVEKAIREVEDIIMKRENDIVEYSKMKSLNRNLFLSYFTIDKFVGRYLNTINRL